MSPGRHTHQEREGLTCIGVYERLIEASLERIWENVRDWEHLPWLHRTSFSGIDQIESGEWGWRATVALQPAEPRRQIALELLIEEPELRYVSRALRGESAGTEIWTHLGPCGERTQVHVEFHVPEASAEHPGLYAAYAKQYERLWDEDEAMMLRRSAELARAGGNSASAVADLSLGSLSELLPRLPLVVEYRGRRFRIVEVKGELLAHAATCPHRLGPLTAGPVEDEALRCPWHGYRFDLRSGACLDDPRLALARAPRVEIDPKSSQVRLHATA